MPDTLDAAIANTPFLTSKEADILIVGLRKGKFFDKFKYDPQNQRWVSQKVELSGEKEEKHAEPSRGSGLQKSERENALQETEIELQETADTETGNGEKGEGNGELLSGGTGNGSDAKPLKRTSIDSTPGIQPTYQQPRESNAERKPPAPPRMFTEDWSRFDGDNPP